jgi:HK97 gp10 family phage protein
VSTIRVDWGPVSQLRAGLARGGDRAAAESRRLLVKAASDIKARAMVYAPVDTGNLRSSITYEIKGTAHGASAEIGPTALYGFWVEYGTSTRQPDPFMGDAFDNVAPQFEAAMAALGVRAASW